MVKVPKDDISITKQAARFHHFGKATGREREHCLTAFQSAIVKAHAATPVHDAVDEDPVNPAFHDRWNREPPKRKLEDEQVATQYLVNLDLDIMSEGVTL